MNSLCPETTNLEEARIRGAYAKREPGVLYSWFNPGHLFMVQERERRVLALLKQYECCPLGSKKILEVGCGTGFWLREFIKWGARPENIMGIDVLPDRVAQARSLCPNGVRIEHGNAGRLTLDDGRFDLVLQSTVFTSILNFSTKQQIASEMLRVVKKEGLILWYDYHVNNPWNPDVRGVKKGEIRRLFPDCRIELRRITVAPPITRLIAPYSWLMCHALGKIPLLCTHYLGVIQKN